MKELKIIAIVGMSIFLIGSSCNDDGSTLSEMTCAKAVVVGRFSSSGGGIALSLDKAAFNSEDSRKVFNDDNVYLNVVQVLNLQEKYLTTGTQIYFTARLATDEDTSKYPPASSDGLPAKSSIVILNMTNNKCEPIND